MYLFTTLFVISVLLWCDTRLTSSASMTNSPVISEITQDLVAGMGEDIEFNCTVKNVGRMSVSWAKRTSDSDSGSVVLSMRSILSLSDPRYSIEETKDDKTDSATYTFKITKVEAADMGKYECQVILTATDKIAKKLKLSVKHPAVISEDRTPKTVLVIEGESLEITCQAEGFPQPTISWQRENNAIMPAGGKSFHGPILRIKQVHRLDRGNYYCIAGNGVGQPDRRIVRIEIEFRPQIAVRRPKVAAFLKNMVKLECTVQAYPAPAVFWYRNGVKIQTSSQYEISNTASAQETTTSELRLAHVTESDYGDYYCNATNKMGHADARLHVFESVMPLTTNLNY